MPPQTIQRRPKKAERRALDGAAPKAKKLTPEEQEEADEKALEEACEKWCGRVIRLVTLGSMLMGLLSPVYEFVMRAPVILHPTDLSGRTIVITGATDGVGTAATRRLARDGAHIIFGARNMSRGLAAAAALRRETGNAGIEARYLDLANLSSVVEFAASLSTASGDEEGEGVPAVTALLNNAGSLENACTPTVDGFETATQVNYLAPALLTRLLVPQLEQSVGSRIVHLGCPVAEKGQLTLEHLEALPLVAEESEASCDVFQRYASAKLMTAAFSGQLAQRLQNREGIGLSVFPVTTNVFDPVSVNTAFAAHQPAAPSGRRRMSFMPQMLIRRGLAWLLAPLWRRLGRLFMRSPETAGDGLVHVATSSHLARVSGKLYSLSSPGALSREAGCKLPALELCGQVAAPGPLLAAEASTLESLWQATNAALAPWLAGGAERPAGQPTAADAAGRPQAAADAAGRAQAAAAPHEEAWMVDDDF